MAAPLASELVPTELVPPELVSTEFAPAELAPAAGTGASVLAVPPGRAGVTLEIVIPAFNEAARLPATLWLLCLKLRQLAVPASVVVVDNGSTDGTPDIVLGWPRSILPVRLVRCPQRGKGAAVRAGLLATSAPVVGFCDADLAADLAGLEEIVTLVRTGHPVVIGSRNHPGSCVQIRHSVCRRLGARVFRFAVHRLVPDVRDTQCGYKFFHGPTARTLAARMRSPGFAFDVELLARFQRIGTRVVEVPVRWRDVPGSTFSPLRDGWRSFREVYGIWNLLRRERVVEEYAPDSDLDVHRVSPTPLRAVPDRAVGG